MPLIANIRGTVLERGPEGVVIDVGGVGYALHVTASALETLPPVGGDTSLPVHTHWSGEQGPQLFGFLDAVERGLFRTLITVKNIGPKAALAILSSVAAPDLVQAIVAGDVRRLSQVKGVGKKTAERLCVELRDTIAAAAATASSATGSMRTQATSDPPLPQRLREVVGYLQALQLRPEEYEPILPKLDPSLEIPALVKNVLAELRQAREGE